MTFVEYVLGAWLVLMLMGVSGLCIWSAIWAPPDSGPTGGALWTAWLVYRTGQGLLLLVIGTILTFVLAMFVIALTRMFA